MINTDYDSDLLFQNEYLMTVRDALKGSPYVKAKGELYLIPPNDNTSTEKYTKFKRGAEFDDYTQKTLQSMVGRLKLNNTNSELPDNSLDFIINDIDGDGLSLVGALENTASEVLSAKYQVAVVDYNGLTEVAIEQATQADVERENPRPVIKFYSRESIVKVYFSTVNGKKQLSYIMLRELGETFNQDTGESTCVESYIILALDENGGYYQQKIVKNGGDGSTEGEREYITINSTPLNYIPLVFLSDEEIDNELPCEFGFLSPIAQICYDRYQMSGLYKYFLEKLLPTTYVMVGDRFDVERFQALNQNRTDIVHGGVNIIPDGADIIKSGAEGNVDAYVQYFANSEEKARSLGAVIPKKQGENKTATEAVMNVGEQNATLNPLVNHVEIGYKWLIGYCAVFTGAITMDNIVDYIDNIGLKLPRKFTEPTLDAQQAQAVRENYMSGLTDKKTAIEMLIKLGYADGDAQEMIDNLEMEGR